MFTGADREYFKKTSDGKPSPAERRFWRDDAPARRETLLPFFWTTIAKEGVSAVFDGIYPTTLTPYDTEILGVINKNEVK